MSNEASIPSTLLPKTASSLLRQGLLGNAIKDAFLSAAPGLQAVEQRVTQSLVSDAALLTEISGYLQQLGGKRVRPLMTILTAKLFGQSEPSSELIEAAAGIELIHMATLLHDDIIDQSPTRRSKPSAYHQYGLTSTLLTGDFLLVRAFGLCAKLDTFVIEATEAACVALTEGELLEGKLSPERQLSLDEYLNIIDKKTASLFCLSAKVGAHLAGAHREEVELLADFGTQAGIAFQAIDDILDVVADEDLLGKPAGADLRQHTPSLVNILWLASGDAKARAFFSTSESSTEQCAEALTFLRSSTVIEQAREIARKHAEEALAKLRAIASDRIDSNTRSQLEALVEYTLDRCM